MSAGTVQVISTIGEPDEPRALNSGERLVFGRDPGVDLPLGQDPWLSRRMGELRVLDDGVQVVNLSRRHALIVQTGSEAIRLPVDGRGAALVLPAGVSLIGSAAMLKQDRSVRVVLAEGWGPVDARVPEAAERVPNLTTEPRLRLNPKTKEFMVALLLCRPWLIDPARMSPLLSAPEIAEEALRVTGSYSELEKLTSDETARRRISEQVHGPLRTLRDKLYAQGLVRDRTGHGLGAIAAALLYYDIITLDHLDLLKDRDWVTAQENRWWGSV